MRIDVKKVLANKNKKPAIESQFEALRENYSVVNELQFMDFVRSQSPALILENSKFVYSLPTSGTDFLMSVMKSNDLSIDQLKSQKENISNFTSKCVSNNYGNKEHMTRLKECVEFIDSEIALKGSTEYLRENLIYQLHLDFLPQATLESSSTVVDELDVIVQNINYKPEMAKRYESVVKQIKTMNVGLIGANFVPLLVKNTALLIGMTILVGGVTMTLIVSLPLLLVSAAIEKSINKTYIASYNSIIDKEIKKVNEAINDADDDKLVYLGEYLKNLKAAKSKLLDYKASRGPKAVGKIQKQIKKAVKESAGVAISMGILNADLYPRRVIDKVLHTDAEPTKIKKMLNHYDTQIARYEADLKSYKSGSNDSKNIIEMKYKKVVVASQLEKYLTDVISDLKAVREKLDKRLSEIESKPVKESIAQMAPDVPVGESDEGDDDDVDSDKFVDAFLDAEVQVDGEDESEYEYPDSDDDEDPLEHDDDDDDYIDFDDEEEPTEETVIRDAAYLKLQFALEFLNCFDTDNDEINMESFNNMIKIANSYSILEEAGPVTNAARKVALKAEDASRSLAHGARNVGSSMKHVGVVTKRIPEHIDNLVNDTLNKIHKMDSDERRKRIIEGGFKLKLYKIIRNGILVGAAFVVHPALAAIGIMTSVAIDKNLDHKERQQILHELENELNIVKEKIEDSRGDENKQKKYELMRIQHKLEDDIAKIRYRLN